MSSILFFSLQKNYQQGVGRVVGFESHLMLANPGLKVNGNLDFSLIRMFLFCVARDYTSSKLKDKYKEKTSPKKCDTKH